MFTTNTKKYLGSTGRAVERMPLPSPIPAKRATFPAQGPAQFTQYANFIGKVLPSELTCH